MKIEYASDIQLHLEGASTGDGGIKLTRSSANKFATIRYAGDYLRFHTDNQTGTNDYAMALANNKDATFAGDILQLISGVNSKVYLGETATH